MMDNELDYWRYTAFRLAQALCSCTYQFAGDSTIAGGEWYARGAEVQEHFRALGLDEHKIGNPDRDKWNPEWEKSPINMTLRPWGLDFDKYDSEELAQNWHKVDKHDGNPGRGVNRQDGNP